jgi:hypothetical protein
MNQTKRRQYRKEYKTLAEVGRLPEGLNYRDSVIVVGTRKDDSLQELEDVDGRRYWNIFKGMIKLNEIGVIEDTVLERYRSRKEDLMTLAKKTANERKKEELKGYRGPRNSPNSLGSLVGGDDKGPRGKIRIRGGRSGKSIGD